MLKDIDMILMEETDTEVSETEGTETEKKGNNIAWLGWYIIFVGIFSIRPIFTLASKFIFGS